MESTLTQVIFFSLVGGVLSLVGALILISSRKRAKALATYATPFAAGALLVAAFTDLLSEASHEGSIETALLFTLVGILAFFLLERSIRWFHHHHDEKDKSSTDPTASLIIIGDTLHNFIDGIAIAAGFLVSPATGIVVTIAVAAHEIPQEIGDFGILLHKGLSRAKAIVINVLSALATTIAAIIFFQSGSSVDTQLDVILGLVAGFFIYIALSDIIPEIHENKDRRLATWQSILLISGAIVVGLVTSSLHQYIDQNDNHKEIHHDTHYSDEHEEDPHDHEHEDH